MEKYILKILLSINILLFIFLLTKNEGLIHYNTINKQHKKLKSHRYYPCMHAREEI